MTTVLTRRVPLDYQKRYSVDGRNWNRVLTLTNAQKLDLPIETPVGTVVQIIDWIAAGFTGPKQELIAQDPSNQSHWISV